jgi:Fe-S-cluster containining protein
MDGTRNHTLPPEYEKLLQLAKSNRKENKIFLEKLKKKKHRDLDQVTNQFHDDAFLKIDCLACANCCATTGPLFRNRDIQTLAENLNMKPSTFTEKYLRMDEDGDWVLKKVPCHFLGSDKMCTVYSIRPGACRDYPHTQQRNIAGKLSITLLNTMICPAVSVVVENLKRHYKV